MKTPIYQEIARLLIANGNARQSGNDFWESKHLERISDLVREHFPSGSGFDNGTHFDFAASTPAKIVFETGFHHMTKHGYYDGWTNHTITIRPSLAFGFDMKISGRDRRDIKELIADMFDWSLSFTDWNHADLTVADYLEAAK